MTIATTPVSAATAAQVASQVNDKATIAGNFQTFLTLLTTQLKNNDQLASIVTMEKSAQSTLAMSFVGQTVAVDGQTTQLLNGAAKWTFSVPKPATAQVNITNSAG